MQQTCTHANNQPKCRQDTKRVSELLQHTIHHSTRTAHRCLAKDVEDEGLLVCVMCSTTPIRTVGNVNPVVPERILPDVSVPVGANISRAKTDRAASEKR